jgi:opacity protein-like surface antigen
MKKTSVRKVAAGTAVMVFAVAGPVAAQTRVSPWIGLYAPASDLGSVQAVDFGKKSSTLAYGADLDFGASGLLGFRVGGGYASDSEVDFDDQTCVSCEIRATVLTATGAIVLRPLPLPGIRPYVLAGAGWKWYDFDFDGDIEDQLEDQSNFTWQGGVGAVINPDGGLSLFAELSDFVSEFDFEDGSTGNTQHDLVLKAGLSLRLGGSR